MNGINWGNIPNNYMPPITYQPVVQQPQVQIIQVNGENGVDAYQMGPNSSALLLDTTAPIVWLVQTDGAGYKSKKPYDIVEHQPEPSPEMKTMDERFASIDKRLKIIEEALLDESNS